MVFGTKKIIYLGIILFFLALSFGTGILVAQKKIERLGLNATSKITINLSQNKAGGDSILENLIGNKVEENIHLAEAKAEEANNQEENKFTFGIIGDTQYFKPGNPNGGFQKAVGLLSSKNVDLVMTEGDLLSSCGSDCEAKLASWKSIMGPLYPKAYELMGNHDRTDKEKSDAAWQNFFNLPANGPAGYSELVYSFNFKNSHFVVLNSEKPSENMISDAQRAWLEQDLNKNKQANTFVFFHEPAYPVSSKIDESLDAKPKERDALWNILSSHKVTAVFNGHEHIASRRKIGSLYQFVFGNTDSFNHDAPKPGMAEYSYVGQTAGVVEVDGQKITVNTYSVDEKLLDSFALVK